MIPKMPPNLRPYEAYCHKAIMEERFKQCHGNIAERTYRHRLADGMLQVIYQIAHKKESKDARC